MLVCVVTTISVTSYSPFQITVFALTTPPYALCVENVSVKVPMCQDVTGMEHAAMWKWRHYWGLPGQEGRNYWTKGGRAVMMVCVCVCACVCVCVQTKSERCTTKHCRTTATRYTTSSLHNLRTVNCTRPRNCLHTTQVDTDLYCWCCTVHAARISFRSGTCSLSPSDSDTRVLRNILTFTTGRGGSVRRRQTSTSCYQTSIWIYVIK